jgi:hypothetical protein
MQIDWKKMHIDLLRPGERVELKAVHDFELKLSDGKDLYKNWKKGELMMIQQPDPSPISQEDGIH